MKNHKSEEALYERMRNLAQVNKTSLKESQNRTLGTLINTKRADNGVAYGIIKEQHKYYIKKGGLNENQNIADFAYIGGLSNITDYQYNKLSEAEKQMNMLLKNINEGISSKMDKNGSKGNSKKVLTEDKASQEIEMAADKVDDLEAATDAAEVPAEPHMEAPPAGEEGGEEGGEEMAAGIDAMPSDDEETPIKDTPADDDVPAGDDIDIDGEEGSIDGEEGAVDGEEKDEATREIEKSLGKITNTLRKTELTDSQVISYVKTFLAAFKEKFPDIDIEDRKEMAEKITKVVSPEEIEDLGQNVEDTDINVDAETADIDEEQCDECGGFAKYAESRGYDADSIKECGEEEMTNLISGYANANSEGQNDGDFKAIALFITPEIVDKLKGEYGHEEFANQVEPFSQEMNETTSEDRDAQINELFGGLKNLAKDAGQGIKSGAQNVGQSIKRGAQDVAQKVGDATTAVKQSYHTGELPNEVKKLEGFAAKLGQQIGALNSRMEKSGKEPINVQSILTTIKNQVASGGSADLSRYTNEEGIPVDHTEVQPMMENINGVDDLKNYVGQEFIVLDTIEDFARLSDTYYKEGEVYKLKRVDDTKQIPVAYFENKYEQNPTTGEYSYSANIKVEDVLNKMKPVSEDSNSIEEDVDEYSSDEIKSEEEFREYATTVLKKAHGDDYDTDKAEYMIKGLVNMTKASDEENWGDAIGILQQSLDESKLEEDVDIKVSEKEGKKLSSDNTPEVEMKEGVEEKEDDLNIDDLDVGTEETSDDEVLDLTKHDKPEMDINTAGFDSMGGGVIKPEGAETTTVEVTKDSVNVNLKENKSRKKEGEVISESEKKLRKYIRNRLEEHAGIRKPSLNENKKSEAIQKLDRVIDKQFNLFENTAKKKVNEVFGWSAKEKFQNLDPIDTQAVEELFKKVYSSALGLGQAVRTAANQTSTNEKYELLKQYFENNGGTIRVANNKLMYQPESLKQKSISSKFAGGGTQGKTTAGGV